MVNHRKNCNRMRKLILNTG